MNRLKESGREPVTSQHFQYGQSRNPYSEKIKQAGFGVYGDKDTEDKKGKWRELFKVSSSTPLHVEIGCNGGHVSLEWARLTPQELYLGLDYKFKQVFLAHEKAIKRNLKNIGFIRATAERLPFIFGAGEIDSLYLFFPDPWAKKKQLKNRLFRDQWLRSVAHCLRSGALFHVKTDHRGYFDWMLEEAAKVEDLFARETFTYNLHEDFENAKKLNFPEVTLFEKIFVKQGLPIHEVKLRRK